MRRTERRARDGNNVFTTLHETEIRENGAHTLLSRPLLGRGKLIFRKMRQGEQNVRRFHISMHEAARVEMPEGLGHLQHDTENPVEVFRGADGIRLPENLLEGDPREVVHGVEDVITDPAEGSALVEGAALVVRVAAADNVDLVAVRIRVEQGGALLDEATLATPPYELPLQLAAVDTDTQLVVTAEADDSSGNTGLAAPISASRAFAFLC